MSTYSLTHLTGKPAQANRIAVVQGFEAKRRTWIALVVGGFALLMVTAITWPLLSVVAILPGAAAGIAVVSALLVRSRSEPERLWIASRRDRLRSDAGTFYVGGEPVDPTATEVFVLVRGTVPGEPVPPERDAHATEPVRQMEAAW
ncbi:hypothetical protein HF998_00230 [Cellulomonas hominis]|nr:hypothetical protein [Cellulomonas hominis]